MFKIGSKSATGQNAFAVFREMKKAGLKPDVSFMNDLMQDFRKAGKFGQMDSIFGRMDGKDSEYPRHNTESLIILLQATLDKYKNYTTKLRESNRRPKPEDTKYFENRVKQDMDEIRASDKTVFFQPRIYELYAECLSLIHADDPQKHIEAMNNLASEVKANGSEASQKTTFGLLKYHVHNKNEVEAFKMFDQLKEQGTLTQEAYELIERANKEAMEKELIRTIGPLFEPFDKPLVNVTGSRVMRKKAVASVVTGRVIPNSKYVAKKSLTHNKKQKSEK